MNNNKSTTWVTGLFAAIYLSSAWADASFGQRTETGFIRGQRDDLGLIREVEQEFSSNRSVRVSVENGIRTVHITEDNLKASITEDANEQITMRIKRQYGPGQLGQLMESQPELYMYLKSIPAEFGDSQIELSVGVTRTYEASSAEDLRERFPEAYEIYERFSKMQLINMAEPGVIWLDGQRLRLDPRRMRNHDNDNQNDEDDKSKHPNPKG